jgi:hypothetical protein
MTENKLLQIKFKVELWNRILAASQADSRTITGWVRHLINKELDKAREVNNADV